MHWFGLDWWEIVINVVVLAIIPGLLAAGDGHLAAEAITGDKPYRFATDMYQILRSAGWNVLGMRPVMLYTRWKGLMVQFHAKDQLNLADVTAVDVPEDSLAGVLINALMKADVGLVTVKPTPDEPEDCVTLVIGPYPAH